MVKKELVRILYERHGGMKLEEVEQSVDALIDLAREAMWSPDGLRISGFGSFQPRQRQARDIRLPDGSRIFTPSRDHMKFQPSGKLKLRLNQ